MNDTYRGEVLLSDGRVETAVLKDLEIRQLANELLAAVLGRAVGLPIPDVALGRARPEDLSMAKAPRLDDGSRIAFVSRDMKMPNLKRWLQANSFNAVASQTIINDIKSWPALGVLYAFDAWVANVDRHPGNLLFGGKHEVWLIDHGHCFSGPAWKATDLGADTSYRHRLLEWLTDQLSLDDRVRRSVEAEGSAAKMDQIDWMAVTSDSRVNSLLPPDDVQAVIAFLRDRVPNVPRHTNAALGLPSLV